MQPTEEQRWAKPAVILVATDLRELDRLMPHALEQAEQAGAQLLLLHAITPAERMPADAAGRPYYDPIGAEELARQGIGFWCQMAVTRGLRCKGLIVDGHPAEQIVRIAQSSEAGRILLGTSRGGKLGTLLLGSVAERVLHAVEIPVMTIGPEVGPPTEKGCGLKVVLHATKLKANARPSAELACQIAQSQGARLRILHVLPATRGNELAEPDPHAAQAARQQLAQLAQLSGGSGCTTIECQVLGGNPAVAILAEAAAHQADLIVLGASQRSRLANLARGRILYRILTEAPCPVLTLRDLEN